MSFKKAFQRFVTISFIVMFGFIIGTRFGLDLIQSGKCWLDKTEISINCNLLP